MPTGPMHERLISAEFDGGGNLTRVEVEDCRCMIGSNHDDDGNEVDDWQDLENDGQYDPDEEGMCENIVHGGDPDYPEYALARHDFTNPVDGSAMRLCDACFEFLSGPMR